MYTCVRNLGWWEGRIRRIKTTRRGGIRNGGRRRKKKEEAQEERRNKLESMMGVSKQASKGSHNRHCQNSPPTCLLQGWNPTQPSPPTIQWELGPGQGRPATRSYTFSSQSLIQGSKSCGKSILHYFSTISIRDS